MIEYVLQLISSVSSLIIFAFTLAVVYGVKCWLSHSSDLPPMPCLPIPVFGHSLFLRPSVLGSLRRWRQQVGDIFTIYISGRPNIVINSYELLHDAFVKQADSFSNRPRTVRQKVLGGNRPTAGIVGNSSASWKEQRSVSMTILRNFGMGRNLMAERISREVEEYLKVLTETHGEATNVRLITNAAVSNVICAVLKGDRFDYKDPIFVHLVEQNKFALRLVPTSSILNTFPWLRFLPGDLFGAKMLFRVFRELQEFFSQHFIQRFRTTMHDTSTDNFIKAYLREMQKRIDSGQETYLDDTNLERCIDNLFVAGTDTTSSSLLWALVFSVRHPECQEKIYQEIEEVVGTDRLPNMQDKPKMNFLNAFIMESQRLGSIAPLGLPHVCSSTTKVGGYTIPKGAVILSHIDAILKDPNVWGDAEVFRPERFMDEDSKLVAPNEFIPFSLGRRICLGESLAKMELFLFLSAMFQRFQILPETPGTMPSAHPIFGITMEPVPFRLRFKPRC